MNYKLFLLLVLMGRCSASEPPAMISGNIKDLSGFTMRIGFEVEDTIESSMENKVEKKINASEIKDLIRRWDAISKKFNKTKPQLKCCSQLATSEKYYDLKKHIDNYIKNVHKPKVYGVNSEQE